MATLVKTRTPLVIPRSVQRLAGIRTGDKIEFTVAAGGVILASRAQTEKMPALDARLAEAEKGPFHGPFSNGSELAVYLKAFKRRQAPARQSKPPR